jgi:hypothetical protein
MTGFGTLELEERRESDSERPQPADVEQVAAR